MISFSSRKKLSSFLILTITLLLFLGLFGCTSSQPSTGTSSHTTTPTNNPTPTHKPLTKREASAIAYSKVRATWVKLLKEKNYVWRTHFINNVAVLNKTSKLLVRHKVLNTTVYDSNGTYFGYTHGVLVNDSVYIDPKTRTYMACLVVNGTAGCLKYDEEATFNHSIVANMDSIIPKYSLPLQIRQFDVLNRTGNLVLIGNKSTPNCPHLYTFRLYYVNLTLPQIKEAGMNPTYYVFSPNVTYTVSYCIGNNQTKAVNVTIMINSSSNPILIHKYYVWNYTQLSTPKELQPPNMPIVNESKMLHLMTMQAAEAKLVDRCRVESLPHVPDLCIKTQAIGNNLPDLCAAAGSERDNCYVVLGTKLNRLSICDKVSNETMRNGCKLQVAVQERDPKMCYQITDQNMVERCVGLVKNQTSVNGGMENQSAEQSSMPSSSHQTIKK